MQHMAGWVLNLVDQRPQKFLLNWFSKVFLNVWNERLFEQSPKFKFSQIKIFPGQILLFVMGIAFQCFNLENRNWIFYHCLAKTSYQKSTASFQRLPTVFLHTKSDREVPDMASNIWILYRINFSKSSDVCKEVFNWVL